MENESAQKPEIDSASQPTAEPATSPQPASSPATGQAPPPMISSDDKNLSMLAHLLALFTGFLGPLIIYLIKKDDSAYVRAHAVEALNFQITIAIYLIVSFFLAFVLIGIVLIPVVTILNIVCIILASIKASDGVLYRYPLTIRLVT